MRVAVVVVSFAVRDRLTRCLQSVAAGLPDSEICIVDNASPDGSAAAAARLPGVQVIALPQNIGFSAAVNRGVAATTAPLVLLLNPDAELPAGCQEALTQPLREAEGVWAAGFRQTDAHGRVQLCIGPRPTLLREFGRRLLQRRLDAGGRLFARLLDAACRRPRAVAWVAGSGLLVRRDAFDRVGGFDERFFLYFEDIDFCLRLRRAGGDVIFDPRLTLRHLRGASAARAPTLARRAYRDSQTYFWRKHHGHLQARGVAAFARWRLPREAR